MQNRELLDRLTRLAEKQAGIAAEQEGVLGVVISGSIARGDVWEGSDVDLHVLWESGEKRSAIGGFVEGALINVHDVYAGYMDYITGTMKGFCRNDVADQLYGCRIFYDPRGMWSRYKSIIDSRRFDPEIIAGKVEFRMEQARKELSRAEKAHELEDWASVLFYAQQAAMEAAFGATVKCGSLIKSANRFPENLKILAEQNGLEKLYEFFRQIHRLTGNIETVERVVVACESVPRIFAQELERMGISEDRAREVVEDYLIDEMIRCKEIPDSAIRASLRSWNAVKYGYYDGQVIWMRTNRNMVIPWWSSWFRVACGVDDIDMNSPTIWEHICQPTIAEDLRRFPGASDAFYNLFLDFLCFSPQDLVCAQESIQALHEMISVLQS